MAISLLAFLWALLGCGTSLGQHGPAGIHAPSPWPVSGPHDPAPADGGGALPS
jgi:hypothetical protein